MWTVLFVIVNQIAYTVVVRLASSGTADRRRRHRLHDLLQRLPAGDGAARDHHGLAGHRGAAPAVGERRRRTPRRDLAGSLAYTLRTALALIVPFSLLLPVVATELSDVIWGYGAAAATSENYAPTLALFAPGCPLLHRALPDAARVLRPRADPDGVLGAVRDRRGQHRAGAGPGRPTDAPAHPPALVLAYAGAYAVGAVASYSLLRHLLGGLRTPGAGAVPGPDAARRRAGRAGGGRPRPAAARRTGRHPDSKLGSVLFLAVVGLVDAAVFLPLARLLRISEVTELVETVTRRLRLPGRRVTFPLR